MTFDVIVTFKARVPGKSLNFTPKTYRSMESLAKYHHLSERHGFYCQRATISFTTTEAVNAGMLPMTFDLTHPCASYARAPRIVDRVLPRELLELKSAGS